MHTKRKPLQQGPRTASQGRVLVFLVLAAFAALPASADPIHLRCLITDKYLASDYGNEIPRAQRELCEKLRILLDAKALLLAWDYVVDNGSQAPPTPAFVLTLSNEGQRREVALRLEPRNSPSAFWVQVWKEPGDPLVDPILRKAAEFFAEKVDELLVTPFEEALYSRLKGIPLASANWSPAGPPRVATELPWKGNETLRASRFRLSCQRSNGGVVEEFESHALRRPENGKYSLEATYRLSDKKRVVEILHEVKQFHPKWLFLLQFQNPDDTEVFSE